MSGQELDPTGAKILDGAVRVLGDFGFKRATVELVAKYAGVSHMTIYRRWPTKNELLRTAVVSEFITLLDGAFTRAAETDTPFAEQALTAFTETVWAVQNHPLVERELNAESGEQSALLSTNAGVVIEAATPLVAQRLQQLAATAKSAPDDVDPIADVFIRLAHSLVTIKRPDQPLGTLDAVGAYARECFGPYLLVRSGSAAPTAAAPSGHRPYLQIAAASAVGVLVLGAGLAAVLNSQVRIPFIGPANISKPTPPATSSPPPAPGTRDVPAPDVPAPDVPAMDGVLPAPQAPSAFTPSGGSVTAPPAWQPAQSPQVLVPPAGSALSPGGFIGSGGGSSADGPAPVNPFPANPAPPPPPAPNPAPKPPPPGPQGNQPGPPPAPKPPGPKPPPPAPKQPPPPQNRPGPPN